MRSNASGERISQPGRLGVQKHGDLLQGHVNIRHGPLEGCPHAVKVVTR